jgi:hypothetical protein
MPAALFHETLAVEAQIPEIAKIVKGRVSKGS